jgi:hypothetical protein
MCAKYYVRCGELERIVIASTPTEACERCIDLSNGETIDPYNFSVSEKGHRGVIYKDGVSISDSNMLEPEFLIPTDDVISTFGIEENTEDGA